ncbi:hypothetical protein B0E53_04743 [Micromonospora sp. MH33]|nr:hypothetical protein B0E53_04743 [Micromonospora sp. MH33]
MTMTNLCFSFMRSTVRRRGGGNQTGRRLAPAGPRYAGRGGRNRP